MELPRHLLCLYSLPSALTSFFHRKISHGLLGIMLILAIMMGSVLISQLTADEGEVDLSGVPSVIIAAVEKATNGTITGAEFEVEGGVEMYEVTVVDGDVEYEVDVTPQGEVLEVIVDDDSDDEQLLIYAYVAAFGGSLAFVVYAMWVYRIYVGPLPCDKKSDHKENLNQGEGEGVAAGHL